MGPLGRGRGSGLCRRRPDTRDGLRPCSCFTSDIVRGSNVAVCPPRGPTFPFMPCVLLHEGSYGRVAATANATHLFRIDHYTILVHKSMPVPRLLVTYKTY